MRGNSHVRFLGEKGAVMPLTYPILKSRVTFCRIPHHSACCNNLVFEDLQERDLLYVPACGGITEQALFGPVHRPDFLPGAGKLPFSFHGCMERRGAGSAPGPDCFGKNPPYAYDFPTTILGDDRK